MKTIPFGDAVDASFMTQFGYELRVDATTPVQLGSFFEGPCSIKTTLTGIRRVGAFSYINGPGRFSEVSIGRYCSIAERVSVGYPEHPTDWMSTSSMQYLRPKWAATSGTWTPALHEPVHHTRIGDDVWIGAGAFIRSGLTIGTGAIIGAHSVVTKDVPPFTIVAGNPARPIRVRIRDHLIPRVLHSGWWRFSPAQLNGCPYDDPEAAVEFVQRLRDNGAREYRAPVIRITEAGAEVSLGSDADQGVNNGFPKASEVLNGAGSDEAKLTSSEI